MNLMEEKNMSKFCVYCGNEMEDNDNACGNCGKLVSD